MSRSRIVRPLFRHTHNTHGCSPSAFSRFLVVRLDVQSNRINNTRAPCAKSAKSANFVDVVHILFLFLVRICAHLCTKCINTRILIFCHFAGRKTGRRSFYSAAHKKPLKSCKEVVPRGAKVVRRAICFWYLIISATHRPFVRGVFILCVFIFIFSLWRRGCVPAKDPPRPVCFICYFFAPFAVSPSPSMASRASARFSPPFMERAAL